MDETTLFERSDGVAKLTFYRPGRLNSFTGQMHGKVADALGRVASQQSIGAPTVPPDRHPFRLSCNELQPGYGITTESRTVTLEDIAHVAHFTGESMPAPLTAQPNALKTAEMGKLRWNVRVTGQDDVLIATSDPLTMTAV